MFDWFTLALRGVACTEGIGVLERYFLELYHVVLLSSKRGDRELAGE